MPILTKSEVLKCLIAVPVLADRNQKCFGSMLIYAELLYLCHIRSVSVVLRIFTECCCFELCRGFCAGAGAVAGTAIAGGTIVGITAVDATYGGFNDPTH